MYRPVTIKEIEMAQNSLRSLRSAVSNTSKGSVGNEAREQLRVLSAQVNTASITIDVLRSDLHNPNVKALVSEYEIIERRTRDIVDDLSKSVEYTGPRRGTMSTAEKTKYVATYGSERFLALPR